MVQELVTRILATVVDRARALPVINVQTLVLQLNEAFRALDVPELVEEGVVFLLLERFNHDV